jgi:hypothetical protein
VCGHFLPGVIFPGAVILRYRFLCDLLPEPSPMIQFFAISDFFLGVIALHGCVRSHSFQLTFAFYEQSDPAEDRLIARAWFFASKNFWGNRFALQIGGTKILVD